MGAARRAGVCVAALRVHGAGHVHAVGRATQSLKSESDGGREERQVIVDVGGRGFVDGLNASEAGGRNDAHPEFIGQERLKAVHPAGPAQEDQAAEGDLVLLREVADGVAHLPDERAQRRGDASMTSPRLEAGASFVSMLSASSS